jgi:hypothetical protein
LGEGKGEGSSAFRKFSQAHLQICKKVIIPKAHDAIALLLNENSSLLICLDLRRVLSTIQLDHQVLFHTTKVDNERTNGVLAPELNPRQLTATQLRPKFFLGVGNIISQLTGTIFLFSWVR